MKYLNVLQINYVKCAKSLQKNLMLQTKLHNSYFQYDVKLLGTYKLPCGTNLKNFFMTAVYLIRIYFFYIPFRKLLNLSFSHLTNHYPPTISGQNDQPCCQDDHPCFKLWQNISSWTNDNIIGMTHHHVPLISMACNSCIWQAKEQKH